MNLYDVFLAIGFLLTAFGLVLSIVSEGPNIVLLSRNLASRSIEINPLQVSLRTLLIVLATAPPLLAWWVWPMTQRAKLEALQRKYAEAEQRLKIADAEYERSRTKSAAEKCGQIERELYLLRSRLSAQR